MSTTIPMSMLGKELMGLLPQQPQQILRVAFKAVEQIAISDVKEHIVKGESPEGVRWLPLRFARPDGSRVPLRDKGTLLASIQARTDTMGITVGSNLRQAPLLHFGGLVKAKKKFLTIPITKEARRYPARKFPRKLFAVIRDKTKGFLAERGKDGLVIHYILRDKVMVPTRPFMGLSEKALRRIDMILLDVATRPTPKGA